MSSSFYLNVENAVGQAVSFIRLAARQGRLDAVLLGMPEEGEQFVRLSMGYVGEAPGDPS